MATSHDPHQQESSGFWGCANVFIGGGFAFCALLAGGALFTGGLGQGWKGKEDPAAAAPVVTAPAAADPNTFSVTLRPGGPTGMAFDTTSFNVKAGQKVKVTFENHNPTLPLQHNLIIGKIGSKERLVAASNAMMTDMAKWMAAGFIPESPDVLAHTRLLNSGETQTIEFTAPAEVGEYPYLCTFIGHATIMQGTMKVE
jgi:azurin